MTVLKTVLTKLKEKKGLTSQNFRSSKEEFVTMKTNSTECKDQSED